MNTSAQPQSTETGASQPWLTGRIVVGIDGSDGSRDALRRAVQLSYMGGASIEVISAWQPPITYGPAWTELSWDQAEESRVALQGVIESMFGDDTPDTLTTEVREGTSARVLIEASEDADLLVVGSRGHGGFAGLLLGSVSAACAEHAHCPVLVVHPSRSRP